MIEFYLEIRLVHICAVIASGAIFLVRGLPLFVRAPWIAPLRFLGYTVDTVLLTAALMLMAIVQQYPFVDAWLTAKLLLLLVYVALGFLAFRSARGLAMRRACWVAGLAIYLFIVSIARAHDPLGVFSGHAW
jgi:uncharacterized membrane protein SirB2